MKTILGVIALIALIDMFGFVMWALSGQLPADSFFVGAITRNILQIILL